MAARHAGCAMGGNKIMALIGIGTTSRATPADVLAIIAAAKARMTQEVLEKPSSHLPLFRQGRGENSILSPLAEKGTPAQRARPTPSPLAGEGWGEGALIKALAALDRPAINPVLSEAAREAGLDLVLLTLDELRAAAPFCVTQSEKSMQQYGIPSVAEAAALAAAGTGARLLLPRIRGQNATASVAILP